MDDLRLPLCGWSVAVTSARRGSDVVALLHQRGARVVHVPAVQMVPFADDLPLRAATEDCLSRKVDIVVATTGVGFGVWLDAADGWGLGEQLRDRLAAARVYARGPKASGVVRANGLPDQPSPSDSTWDILSRLLARDLHGKRVAVQLHGAPLDDFTRSLRAAGAEVVDVPVYRTAPPDDDRVLQRLVEQIVSGEVQAVTFTSAAASTNVLEAADRMGSLDDLLDAFETVLAVCVGKVAAAPLDRLSVATLLPEHARLGALVHVVTSALQSRAVHVRSAGHSIEVRGTGALVDGSFRPLSPLPMAVLHALAAQPGRVLSPATLKAVLPGEGDDRAVEVAISRLRGGLGDARYVSNVVKRGYRLAPDPLVPEPLEPDDVAPPDETAQPAPLLDSVGGRPAVREAVERLYARLLVDPVVSHYFVDVEMPRLKRHKVLLLTQLLGGPARYQGRALAEAHAGLHITSAEFSCVLDHVSEVLGELSVTVEDRASILGTLGELASSVVGA